MKPLSKTCVVFMVISLYHYTSMCTILDFFSFSRMLVEMRLPEIKSVLALQTMMRMLGKDIPFELKCKLEVYKFWFIQCITFIPILIVFSSGSQPKLICPPCTFQGKALSMTDQFTLPNTQYMISTMATMGFYSKPLLDACSKKIIGNLFYFYTKKKLHVHCKET